MIGIPRAPLLLGLAGLLPFVWGMLTQVWSPLHLWSATTLGPNFVGPSLQITYGIVISCFMSGVLWGFATRSSGTMMIAAYGLSVVPALWVFFMVSLRSTTQADNLMIGFGAVLMIDILFHNWGLTPTWWLRLRLVLTAIVIGCLYGASA